MHNAIIFEIYALVYNYFIINFLNLNDFILLNLQIKEGDE